MKNLIVFLALCLVSFALYYFEVIGKARLIELLVVATVSFFAIRAAHSNLNKNNHDFDP